MDPTLRWRLAAAEGCFLAVFAAEAVFRLIAAGGKVKTRLAAASTSVMFMCKTSVAPAGTTATTEVGLYKLSSVYP
jgi:hypothetical protein